MSEIEELRAKLIPQDAIQIQAQIASGQFGEVFKGIILNQCLEETEFRLRCPQSFSDVRVRVRGLL
jgi:hypothetical protein